MACGPGSPIATQIGAGITACQTILNTNPDLEEVILELRRTIVYLKGGLDEKIGGMRYVEPKEYKLGLGEGIIRDLIKVRENGLPDYPLKKTDAEVAWKIAVAALAMAEKGLEQAEAKNEIKKIHKSAKIVSSLLQSALEVVLA
jgi:hypothetical protein